MLYRKINRKKQKERQLQSVFIIRKRQKMKDNCKAFSVTPKSKKKHNSSFKAFCVTA